jgi:hypothetical protein
MDSALIRYHTVFSRGSGGAFCFWPPLYPDGSRGSITLREDGCGFTARKAIILGQQARNREGEKAKAASEGGLCKKAE